MKVRKVRTQYSQIFFPFYLDIMDASDGPDDNTVAIPQSSNFKKRKGYNKPSNNTLTFSFKRRCFHDLSIL